jgi:hypothetical protein
MIDIEVDKSKLIDSIVHGLDVDEVEDFISDLIDQTSWYTVDFRDRVINRLKEDL